jgi:hypothetical protein
MGQPLIAFVFNNASQFNSVTTNGQLCTPDIVVFDTNNGEISVSGTPSSPASISLPPPGKPNNAETVNMYTAASAAINVPKGKLPQFQFAVCDNTGRNALPPTGPSYTNYVVCGLALQNNANGNAPDVTQFPGLEVKVDAGITLLQLSDKNSNKSPTTYKFYVVVQNAAGNIGLIDPKIVNQA